MKNPTVPREYTTDEIRDIFLNHVRGLVQYWEKESRAETSLKKLEGLAFSMLVALDGCAYDCPGFILVPSVHPDDKEYHRSQGENWFPETPDDGLPDLGMLHDYFYEKK